METNEHLSADELKAQLDAITAEREALHAALAQRHEAEKAELAAEIKTLITDRGHEIEEIAQLVLGRKQRHQRRARAAVNASYQGYADPDNPGNIYTRGRMPGWLIDKMGANGFDPADAQQRAQFKSQHLVPLAA
jgi:DNA-binding protein H-NS